MAQYTSINLQNNQSPLARIEGKVNLGAERWLGKLDTPAGNKVTAENTDGFRVTTSDTADSFGVAVQILDTADTPVVAGNAGFVVSRLSVIGAEASGTFRIRLSWGDVDHTTAVAAGQFTDIIGVITHTDVSGLILEVRTPEIPAGSKMWIAAAQAAAAANYLDCVFAVQER